MVVHEDKFGLLQRKEILRPGRACPINGLLIRSKEGKLLCLKPFDLMTRKFSRQETQRER